MGHEFVDGGGYDPVRFGAGKGKRVCTDVLSGAIDAEGAATLQYR